jgi:uncharacterized protein YbjT (DUF2867 family)
MPERPVFVTGATGNVGRQVVASLVATGVAARALTRDPHGPRLPAGVDVVAGDLADPESFASTLDGVSALFLMWPFATAAGAPELIAAVAERVDRIVYLSSLSVDNAGARPADPITSFHAEIERLVESAATEWTFLRVSGFATNTLGWAPQIRAEGVVRWVHGAAERSLIHERDIADVAAQALTEDRLMHAKPVLTGPERLTQAEQARLIGDAIDRPVRFEEIPVDAARRQMLDAMPASIVDAILDGHAHLANHPEPLTDTVTRVLGRPGRTFREWALDHADDFR